MLKLLLVGACGLFGLDPLSAQNPLPGEWTWEFQLHGDSCWYPCSIPGNNLSALLEAGRIPHPYSAEYLTIADREHSSADCSFRAKVFVDHAGLAHQHIDLHCEPDALCTILVNGAIAGQTENAFRQHRLPVKELLRAGFNEIVFSFRSPGKYADSLYSTHTPALPGGARTMVRKPQFHFGWDFVPEYLTSGLQVHPVLAGWDDTALEHASIQTLFANSDSAKMVLHLSASCLDKSTDTLQVQLCFGCDTLYWIWVVDRGPCEKRCSFTLNRPHLWWPNGMGQPHLYDCHLRLTGQNGSIHTSKPWKTGIRTVKLVQAKDRGGSSFGFEVNGQALFCKGANWVPPDAFQITDESIETLVEAAAASHFNMLRVWGGGRYERDAFYEACDRKGILIWQDFMFACAMYPGGDRFVEEVRREAEYQVSRISGHPSLALWCGNNEISEGWHRWGWQDHLSKADRNQLWRYYQQIFERILPKVVEDRAPGIHYHPTSPTYGRGDHRFRVQGDAHDWGLWHDGMSFSKLIGRIPRFMSEFGFQSYPSLACLSAYLPPDQLMVGSKSLDQLQRHVFGKSIINRYLKANYPLPKDLAGTIYLSQLQAADGMMQIIDAHRRSRPYCMGSLFWQFNDSWPGISWSSIDYLGHWKALQHAVQRAFEPIRFCAEMQKERIVLWGLNDQLESESFVLRASIRDFEGRTLQSHQFTGMLSANCAQKVGQLNPPKPSPQFNNLHYLELEWYVRGDTLRALHYFANPQDLELEKPTFTLSRVQSAGKGYSFELKTDRFARGVYLEEKRGVRFFPNYFDLTPGHSVRVRSEGPLNWDSKSLVITSLYDFK
ncbi:MAG: glycoside hydrolase family 2 protein [Saprospiraceae bacterium]|jgi:beta-mannosidase|nr:glycoside hydrolase family 2 protein [Saprospiraceae bacterium]MBP9209205.1 glycoside hydrolase family 2 protein [Saprospiraceae bacterium]